ncbi:aminoglycoside phosphotransferase family protein [Bacillus pseudomycoides]|uniref:aminoglycoside phosphotransferase family protein n=1 Tax=Bacillus pseudomycoides TaxID=64104 RepID=UPI000BEF31C6|nr:aminoglycoside phosphotransferase family protein [Bacillus pseudomycoides]PEK37637.1 aminoglycoside phosphotransferase [Bacillus pseudomycoides]
MTSYMRDIQQSLPNIPIHSYEQNDNGWDNVAIIINNEWLFRFPRKSQYAKRIPREKELCEILSQSSQEIKVPKYHILYKNELDLIPFCSYYKLIHGEPLTVQTIERLTVKERETVISQLAIFLASLHTIPIEHAVKWGFDTEKPISYWRQIQTKLHVHLACTLTLLEKKTFDCLFENFFEHMYASDFQKTMIHADFTHHHILFDGEKRSIAGIIDFGDAQIGDPAFDFAGLYNNFGSEFTNAIYKRYYTLTPHHDLSFFKRVIQFYQYSPLLHNLVYNFETNNEQEIQKNRKHLQTILQGRS